MNVTIYTTPTCPYCRMAKAFFEENHVQYREVDVSSDDKAAEAMIAKSGQLGVPVITIEKDGKEEVIIGFQKDKLSKLL